MLVETLDRALQTTLYYHRVAVLRSAEQELEQNALTMFRGQAYDVLMAYYQADLSEAQREDENDRKVAAILALIAAALEARIGRDVATLRPGLSAALATALAQSAFAKYGMTGDLRAIDAETYLLNHGAELVKGINKYTRERMRTILARALREGQSVDEVASKLMFSFDEMTYARARKIAITEASKAWSYAEMESGGLMEKAGYKMVKEWLLGPMHPFYDPCDHNHEAGAIPLNRPFPAGDMAPPQHPNCGCSLITYPADGPQPWGTPVNGQVPFLPFGGSDQGDTNA